MSPVLMEALQMLKFALKKERLSFTSSWKAEEKDMSADHLDGDLLGDLLRSTGDSSHADIEDIILEYMEKYEDKVEGDIATSDCI